MEEEKKIKKTAVTNPKIFFSRVKQWFKSKPPFKKALIIFAGLGILFAIYIASVLVRYNDLPINGKTNMTGQSQTEENRFALPFMPGVVCSRLGNFSFNLDVSSSPVTEDAKHIALTTSNGFLLIAKKTETIQNLLKKYDIEYKKDGDNYIYQLTSTMDKEIPEGSPILANSVEGSDFIISIFYDLDKTQEATATLKTIKDSIQGGCKSA